MADQPDWPAHVVYLSEKLDYYLREAQRCGRQGYLADEIRFIEQAAATGRALQATQSCIKPAVPTPSPIRRRALDL